MTRGVVIWHHQAKFIKIINKYLEVRIGPRELMGGDLFSYFSHPDSCCIVAAISVSRADLVFCTTYKSRFVNLLPWKSVLNHFQISPVETGIRCWAPVKKSSSGESNEIIPFVICLMYWIEKV